ncbi:unnamed protein product [Acanthoscelides obtectus]|uniref:DDE-1 domain-containing protein n=1 Tax=Acanthoscelides obtectus TaxID=200917 RepID=A0A9P0K6F4_ACAOB|nr:unnamed protein product [Acanthoscelides obtectus]CAK1667417.1 hypothetical protein AOBTE_LOCUS25823 [Acanthoscelides obtectus]
MNVQLQKGAPPGSLFACHPSGWIQTHLFTEWFHHFLTKVKPSRDEPALLILDGHNTHTRNLEFLRLAKQNGVTIICLPPHTTHKLQPLDKRVMGALKAHYNEEVRVFKRTYKRPITQYDITEIFGRAYLKIQCGSNAVKGFETTGLYPVRRNNFDESDFLKAAQEGSDDESTAAVPEQSETNTATNPTVIEQLYGRPNTPAVETHVTPHDILPLPKLQQKKGTRGRKPGQAKIITSSPYLKELETSLNVSKEKVEAVKRKLGAPKKSRKVQPCPQRETESILTQPSTSGLHLVASKQKARNKRRSSSSTSSEKSEALHYQDSSGDELTQETTVDPDEDAICGYCDGKFSEDQRGEIWIQCILCLQWFHEQCSGHTEANLCAIFASKIASVPV